MKAVEIEFLMKGADGTGTAIDNIRDKVSGLQQQSEDAKLHMVALQNAGKYGELLNALENYKSLLAETHAAAKEGFQAQKAYIDELEKAHWSLGAAKEAAEKSGDAKALAALEDAAKKLDAKIQEANNSLRDFSDINAEILFQKLPAVEEAISRCKEAIKEEGEVAQQTGRNIDDLGNTLGSNSGNATQFSGSIDDVVTNLSNVPGPVGRAASGIEGMRKAAMRFIATPLGITLAAISAALMALNSWFHRTEEGQNALAVGSAYFTQVLESILDVADNVGEWLYKAFTKPKEAVSSLASFIRDQLINRLTAVYESAKGFKMMLDGDWTGGLRQMANGLLQSVTGVKDVTGKIAAYAEDINKKATTRMDITRRQNQLDKESRDYTVQKAKTEAEIAKLRAKGQDTSVSAEERQKALREASRLNKEMYDQEIAFARRRYEIIRDTNALSHSNKADKEKEAEAEAEIYRLEARRDQASGALTRKRNSAANAASAGARKEEARRKKEEALRERQKQLQEKLGQELAELQRKNDADEISAMKEGAEKKLREIDNEYQARKNAIDKQEAEWRRDNKKAGVATGENGLTADQTAALVNARKYANTITRRATEEALREDEKSLREAVNGYLRQYGDYAQKRQAIVEAANGRLCELEEELSRATTAEARAAAQARIDTVKAETREQLDELDVQYGKAKKFLIDLFEDASEKSVAEIDKIIRKYEALVKFLKGDGSMSRDQLKGFGFSDAEIDKALKKLETDGVQSIKAITDAIKNMKGELKDRSPWQTFTTNLNKAIDQLKTADGDITKIGKGISGIGDAVCAFTDPLKQFSSDLSNVFGFDDSKVQGALEALDGLGTTATGVGQIMSGDVVGGITNAVHGISQMVDAFDGLFGADYQQYNNLVEQYDRLISVWDQLIDRKRQYVNMTYGAEAIKAGQEALDLIASRSDAYRTLGIERLNSGASAGSHSIGVRIAQRMSSADWQGIAQSLGMSVAAAQNAMGGRMTGLFSLTTDQIRKLQEDNQVWWAKLDEDTRSYLESILENEEQWAAMQDQLHERLTTTTRENVFDDFLNSLYNLADGSEDVMDDIADNWQKMVNKMAVNNLVGAKFQKNLEDWYENLAKLNEARTNGEITDEEYRKRLDALKAEYEGYVNDAKRDIETLRTAGIVKATDENSGVTQSGKAGAFTTMSQDQGTKLEGLFVSGQMHWASIDDKLTDVSAQIGMAGDTLKRIEEHTGNSASSLDEIKNDIKIIKRDGLKVK